MNIQECDISKLMKNIKKLYDLFKEKVNDEDEISELITLAMSNTNLYNFNWISDGNTFSELLKNAVFRKKFILNIDKINYQSSERIIIKIINSLKYGNMNENDVVLLINMLSKCDCIMDKSIYELGNFISKKFPNLLDYMINTLIKCNKCCDGIIKYITDIDSDVSNDDDYIISNIDSILNNYRYVNMIELNFFTKHIKDINNRVCDILIKHDDECLKFFVKKIFNKYFDEKIDNTFSDKLNGLCDVVILIIKDILKNENIDVSNIEWVARGGYSDVIMIGDKILKIGSTRRTKTFPDNPYVNAMLLRREFEIGDNKALFLEVNEKVDTNIEVTEEELYQLYKKLRELGLIWTDVNYRNVGRLLKDNKVSWREDLPINSQVLGLDSYRGDVELKKGDLVVLDNDFIFDERKPDKSYKMSNNNLYYTFENRYLKEKRTEKRGGNKKRT